MDFRQPATTATPDQRTSSRTSRHLEPLPQDGPSNGPGRPRLRRRERSSSTLVLSSNTTINDQYLSPELRHEREKLLPSTGKPEHRDRRRPSPSGRPSGSRDGASQSRPMSGVLSYGPDIRDPAGSGTPPRVSRPRSAEVQPLQYTPSRSPALQSDGWNEHARLSMYIDDRDGRSRSSTSTPQLPTRVSDTLDAPPPHYDSLSLPADPSSSFPSTLPRSVSNPASPSEPPPLGSTLPFPTAGDNQIPSTPFFPFGIVSTDPSSIPRAGRRPLPTIPDAQGAETTNPLPRRVSQVLSDADRPSMIRRAHSDNGPSSTTASQFVDMTDLDWVVSTLEDDQTAQGVDYETLLTLEEIVGPAAVAAPPRRPDPLGRAGLKPSPVTEESRRYNAEGKLKLKLSLGGVRVERCGICLTQFAAGDVGIILHCRHPFHATCLERWASIKENCPTCRGPLGSDPT